MDYNFAQSLGISPNKGRRGNSGNCKIDVVYESIIAFVIPLAVARFARNRHRHKGLFYIRFVNWLKQK